EPWLIPVTEEMVDHLPKVAPNIRIPNHGQVVTGWDLIVENPPVTTQDANAQVGFLNLRVFGKISGSVMRQQPPRDCVVDGTPAAGETRCFRRPDGSMVEVSVAHGKDMLLPEPLGSADRAPRPDAITADWQYDVARHYRVDGSVVEVWATGMKGAKQGYFTT